MAKKREIPIDAKRNSYILVVDKTNADGFSIRQQITLPDGKRLFPRHPKAAYTTVQKNRQDLQAYVDKLNYGLDLKKQRKLEIQTAFIPESIHDSFLAELKNQVNNKKDLRYLYNRVLKEYFLDFFIGRLQILDPKEWIKNQAAWGNALTGETTESAHILFTDFKASAKTIKTTIQMSNRFMKHLHLQMPNDYPFYEFAPLSKNKLKAYEAERKRLLDEEIGRYIPETDWLVIDQKLPKTIAPFIRLMSFYGLRRAESLGFEQTTSVKVKYLDVTQQLRSFSDKQGTYEPLKDLEVRKTPHWFCGPDVAHGLISQTLDKKMHPDTLSARWDALMESLGMEYRLHDLRRTFITNALRKFNPRDVQMAVGHSNIETTMKYAQDDRQLDDEIWKPAS